MYNLYLIIGDCGVGKTWVMREFIKATGINPNIYTYKTGLYQYLKKDGIIVLGRYTGDVFDGSDRLSMSIMQSNYLMPPIFSEAKLVVAEGDRFTNNTFINKFQPTILRINGDGATGRVLRGSNQTERHIKSISTRVSNITPHIEFANSAECLAFLIDKLKNC